MEKKALSVILWDNWDLIAVDSWVLYMSYSSWRWSENRPFPVSSDTKFGLPNLRLEWWQKQKQTPNQSCYFFNIQESSLLQDCWKHAPQLWNTYIPFLLDMCVILWNHRLYDLKLSWNTYPDIWHIPVALTPFSCINFLKQWLLTINASRALLKPTCMCCWLLNNCVSQMPPSCPLVCSRVFSEQCRPVISVWV